VTSNINIYCRM